MRTSTVIPANKVNCKVNCGAREDALGYEAREASLGWAGKHHSLKHQDTNQVKITNPLKGPVQ